MARTQKKTRQGAERAQEAQPRERVVAAAAELLSRRGLHATSIRELAKHAEAPLGSTYHYFPGGKQQVVTEAVRYAGDWITRALDEALQAGPLEGLRAFMELWRKIITRSDYRAGCPVLSVATQEPEDAAGEQALAAAGQVFEAWSARLADALRGEGVGRREAEQVATLVVATAEGTVALCRASRSVRPLNQVAPQLEAIVAATLAGAARRD